MKVDEIETNSDRQSKKRKKSKRESQETKSIELSDAHHDVPEEMPSVPASLKKKRKSKKMKLTDSSSESVEVFHKESEVSLKSIDEKKTSEEAGVTEAGNSESNLSQENESLVSQSKKKKKKKDKKSQTNSVSESVRSNHDSRSNATKSEKSKKKKWKKKKSKQKNESTKSPSSKNSSHNSNAASSRNEKAISYLETWKNDRSKWKFEKLTQIWLFKNMFDENTIPEASFETLLEYLVDLQGNSKNFVIELCEGIFKKKEETAASEEDQVLERAYERARSIMQCLH